jgi:hypothetical protein
MYVLDESVWMSMPLANNTICQPLRVTTFSASEQHTRFVNASQTVLYTFDSAEGTKKGRLLKPQYMSSILLAY